MGTNDRYMSQWRRVQKGNGEGEDKKWGLHCRGQEETLKDLNGNCLRSCQTVTKYTCLGAGRLLKEVYKTLVTY